MGVAQTADKRPQSHLSSSVTWRHGCGRATGVCGSRLPQCLSISRPGASRKTVTARRARRSRRRRAVQRSRGPTNRRSIRGRRPLLCTCTACWHCAAHAPRPAPQLRLAGNCAPRCASATCRCRVMAADASPAPILSAELYREMAASGLGGACSAAATPRRAWTFRSAASRAANALPNRAASSHAACATAADARAGMFIYCKGPRNAGSRHACRATTQAW